MRITVGLYYNGARYLAAWLGRWTSADPIGIGADGPGLYNYTRGSPIGYTDPSGMAPENVWDKRAATQTAEQQDANVASAGKAAETMGYAGLELWNRGVDDAKWAANAYLDAARGTEVGLARSWDAEPPEPVSFDALKFDDIPEEAKPVADVIEVATIVAGGVGLLKGGFKLARAGLKLLGREAADARKVASAIEGTALNPKITDWKPNASGPRRVDEALDVARTHGVEVPDDIDLKLAVDPKLPGNTGAAYFLPTKRDYRAGDVMSWGRDFLNRHGQVPIKLHPSTLNSDESIVAHLAHELHEIVGLKKSFDASGGTLPASKVRELITPGARAGNLHDQAWDVADALVTRMRKMMGGS